MATFTRLSMAERPIILPLLRQYLQFLQAIDGMDCGGSELQLEIERLAQPALSSKSHVQHDQAEWFALMPHAPVHSPIGCGMMRRIQPAIADCLAEAIPQQASHAEICRIFIAPAARGQGHARQLLQQMIRYAQAQGIDYLWLDTFRNPDHAKSLYLSLGFQLCPAYYLSPAHKLYYFYAPTATICLDHQQCQ